MASPRFGCQDGFSLAARMRDMRTRSRTRTARMVQVAHGGEAAKARCRDLSDTGMKLDLTAPLDLNEQVTVALSRSVVLCGTVAWVNGRECGVTFDGPVDSAALIEAVDWQPAYAAAPATLDLLDSYRASCRPSARNGSGSGQPVRFQPGLAVIVVTGPDREQRGMLRWATDNVAALELEEMIDDEEEPPRILLPAPQGG
jgi:hypothetical protein